MTKPSRISREELARESATALPDKEVLSLLDLNANLDLALDAAAPIDLAIGANANIAAPIEAAASANVLSPDAISAAQGQQATAIDQTITGDATAHGLQDSTINQGATTGDTTQPVDPATTSTTGSLTDGNLLDVNVNLNGDLNLAAPIDGAVAANANAAAPIDAAVSANIDSPGAESVAVADQTALIDQSITGDATAVSDQVSNIAQP
ncbi:MAG TPA: peptidoglycan-binding protein [Mycobacteriales bacterium]|nr:peptidoglycan-binding protein [Mycobacteriales bacterium]